MIRRGGNFAAALYNALVLWYNKWKKRGAAYAGGRKG